MRFRPLYVDYHSEARQIENERRQAAGTKRPVILLRERNANVLPDKGDRQNSNDDHREAKTCSSNHDSPFNSTQDDAVHPNKRPRNDENDDCIVREAAKKRTRNDGSVVFSMTSQGQQGRRLQQHTEKDNNYKNREEEGSITFQPPEAYTRWMGSNSVRRHGTMFLLDSSFIDFFLFLNASVLALLFYSLLQPLFKRSSDSSQSKATAILPFENLAWMDIDEQPPPPTPMTKEERLQQERLEAMKLFQKALACCPVLLQLVSNIQRQCNLKRLTVRSCLPDPKMFVFFGIRYVLDFLSFKLLQQVIQHHAFHRCQETISTRLDMLVRLYQQLKPPSTKLLGEMDAEFQEAFLERYEWPYETPTFDRLESAG
ncbi:MAG: hypothetical protein SGARI_006410, partial [Bacillariaceae sp.]